MAQCREIPGDDMSRYRASDRTEHSCCYEACVEDTTIPIIIGGEHYEDQYEMVCECPNRAAAEMIAEALNKAGG